MRKGLLGRKIGMTQLFLDDGTAVSVTAVEAGPCPVLEVKTKEKHGYAGLKLAFGAKKESRCTSPELGEFKKAGAPPCYFVREVEWDGGGQVKPGDSLKADLFQGIKYVDVTGTTKGRGFAGVVKRHHFGGAPFSHGTTEGSRVPGSLGRQGSVWGKVHKGKKMAGRMGGGRCTIRALELARILPEKNVLLIKGAVPGPTGGYVIVTESRRKAKIVKAPPAGAQKKKIELVKKGK